jgi:indole-3-glycerol phosphate synthase
VSPPAIIVVSESGIRSRADALRLQEAGVDAMLVGERLMRQPDPRRAAAELLGA